MVWALAIAYVAYGGLSWMQALFYGINAGVIGIIMRSAWKLTHVALGRDRLLWAIAAVLALVTAVLEREVVWLFGAAGLVALVKVRGTSSLPAMAMIPGLAATTAPLAGPTTLPHIFWFFAKAGAVVFGSGLAIVPFLYGGTVQQEGWLTDQQFLDAVAVAMITPGPVVITVGFIGYLVAGSPGLLAAAAGVFLPVYLFVVIPAPYFRRLNAQAGVRAFVDGVTAAATGAIAGAAVVLARRAWIDGWTVAIGLVVLASLVRWRIPEVWVVVATGVLGLLLAPKVR
jgi:chromate transporter